VVPLVWRHLHHSSGQHHLISKLSANALLVGAGQQIPLAAHSAADVGRSTGGGGLVLNRHKEPCDIGCPPLDLYHRHHAILSAPGPVMMFLDINPGCLCPLLPLYFHKFTV
jgi:hypothetical protein